MTPQERIRQFVYQGRLGPAEAERLIEAMDPRTQRGPGWLLINPFDRFGGGVAACAGLAVSFASLAATRLGVRFDGFVDLHGRAPGDDVPSLFCSWFEQGCAWILPSVLFWFYAWVLARHVRFRDFLGMVGLARAPMLVLGLAHVALDPRSPVSGALRIPFALVLGLAAVVLYFWFATLLYQGFKNASGLSGAKRTVGFTAMCILSEVFSKLLVIHVHLDELL